MRQTVQPHAFCAPLHVFDKTLRSFFLQLQIALTQWWVCFTPLFQHAAWDFCSYELLCRSVEFIYLRYPNLQWW